MKYREADAKHFELDLAAAAVKLARPWREKQDLSPIARELADARVVMLGEATHGTQEFYALRARLTQELIQNHGFNIVAVEGDWPACQRIDDYVQGRDPIGADPLRGFMRWPTWMWANTEVAKFTQWLRAHNERSARPVGFYGLDVYSLFESIDETLKYLRGFDPFLAATVRGRYDCFAPFQKDERTYAKSLIPYPEGCADEVTSILRDLLRLRVQPDADSAHRLFSAQQNARIVANAEDYYRSMVHGGDDSWNVRDRHMLETLEQILEHRGEDARAVVWAHNTHIGDHRATDMREEGLVNIGGLARMKWGEDEVRLVGFGTFKGEVIAGAAWGGQTQVMKVPAARPGTLEDILHSVADTIGSPQFYLPLRKAPDIFDQKVDHRAIGVVYNPATERFGNYVPTELRRRYDAFVFVDRTSALVPIPHGVDRKEIPETWPQGL